MTAIRQTQMVEPLRRMIDEEIGFYTNHPKITARNEIPDSQCIPIEDPLKWVRVSDVICVYVDMLGSTQLSVAKHDSSTAGVYRLFTSTAIRVFHHHRAPYIDAKGDGVFALFNRNQVYRALVAAVDFKTFSQEEFVPRVARSTSLDIGTHIGIAQRTVLVRRLGFKRVDGRTDRQNEVWAGRPVNMAAKLASLTKDKELLASEHYYNRLRDRRATHTCGCPDGKPEPLWASRDVSADARFDFNRAYLLESCWCEKHGKDTAEALLDRDG